MMKQISPLRHPMIDDMTLRNMSPSTQQCYSYAVADFARYHQISPYTLGMSTGTMLGNNMLSDPHLAILRSYWKHRQPDGDLLFPIAPNSTRPSVRTLCNTALPLTSSSRVSTCG